MSVEWVARLPSIFFSRIKNEFSENLKTKYEMTNSNFSAVGSSNTSAVFPFVYMEEIGWTPNGEDLERNTINSLKDYTLHIHVTDNKSKNNSSEVAREILRIMVKMHFSCRMSPNNTGDNTHSYVLRCSRNIDVDDML